ncbi:glycosyl hydrolase [Vallitalea longa]|uniref:Glycosyl hydrolase n=1 Tax=Vallitalea longa TaxID=2936439 RepID=A0A9W5Y7Y1_9FIRM|nr:glycosyl hydrolase family 65 protein [Vallitalea longa]GKX28732.1 glycosyl hydrolase [Vallitalea longa]
MSWILTNDIYDKKSNKHYEGAYSQGNGYLNIRASFDEDLSEASQNDTFWRLPANVTLEKQRHTLSKWGIYIPGIYGNHPILGEEIINLPYPLGINLFYEGERLDMNTSSFTEFNRQLNLKNGLLQRELNWVTEANNIKVKYTRYCSMATKNMIVQKIELTPQNNGEIIINSFTDSDVTTNGYNHFKEIDIDKECQSVFITTDTDQQIGIHTDLNIVNENVKDNKISIIKNRLNNDTVLQLTVYKKIVIEKRTYFATSIDIDYCGDIKKQLENKIIAYSYEEDLQSHNKIWEEKWNQSDVVVTGNEDVQTAVRFSIYHLLRSANDKDTVAIDAKAYAGEAYFGHYFWDTEVYLLPFFIYTQPEYAKKLIKYRYNTLKGAKSNAEHYGYRGAKYSWESCITGREQCSSWQYADFEVHVTADVIFGLIHYCKNTNDEEFLINEGLEMMIETARYWMERTYKKGDRYHIQGVMGPDEYLAFTNDNTFTNYMVRYTLQATLETVSLAKVKKSDVLSNLNITEDELNKIEDIVNNIVLLVDKDDSFIEQCGNFMEFEDIDIDKIWLDKKRPFGQFISQERNYRSKVLKQADVVALLYLFRKDFDNKMKKNCIDYYEPITTHDSSLSYIFHSLVYSDIDEQEKAYNMLEKSLGIDLTEKGAAEGIHIANCGGIWQALVMGFAGLTNCLESDELKITNKLPDEIDSLSYKIYFKDSWYDIYVDHNESRVTPL